MQPLKHWTHGVLVLVLLLAASAARGEESLSRLQFRSSTDTSVFWPLDSSSSFSSESASLRLDGEEAEAVFVFRPDTRPPVRLMISQSEPSRLFCDLNGDGKCQPEELHTGRRGGNLWQTRFDDVSLPLMIGDATRVVRADIESFLSRNIQVVRVNSSYEGPVSLGDKAYPACLTFRSLFPTGNETNEVILLDTNRDGAFDSFEDRWFSAEGVAYLEDRLWAAKTTYSGTKAEVALAPYAGPTGRLRIQGAGVHRLHVRGKPEREGQSGDPQKSFEMCLPYRGDSTYTLPAGNFSVGKVWLSSGTESPTYWLCSEAGVARILEGQLVEMDLGGPLTATIEAQPRLLSGRVRLDYGGCRNAAGIEYEYDERRPRGAWERRLAPAFEIVNPRGVVVASGRFEYG